MATRVNSAFKGFRILSWAETRFAPSGKDSKINKKASVMRLCRHKM